MEQHKGTIAILHNGHEIIAIIIMSFCVRDSYSEGSGERGQVFESLRQSRCIGQQSTCTSSKGKVTFMYLGSGSSRTTERRPFGSKPMVLDIACRMRVGMGSVSQETYLNQCMSVSRDHV